MSEPVGLNYRRTDNSILTTLLPRGMLGRRNTPSSPTLLLDSPNDTDDDTLWMKKVPTKQTKRETIASPILCSDANGLSNMQRVNNC